MSVNSSYSQDSCLHPQLSSIYSFLTFELCCFITKPGCVIFTAYTITILLLLFPLCIFILYHGAQRWRQQHSSSTAATMTHSDSFTYHLVIMELINVFASVLHCCGIFMVDFQMFLVWYYLSSFTWYGETFFHPLTCVEHYLAVVHPITYLSLRKERGIRIRNIIIGCIWLLCIGETILMSAGNNYLLADVCLLIISVIIISFCSLSVLCVLIRPGPGEQGRDQVRVDQSKQRAFYTIVAILGVLLLRCVCGLAAAIQPVLNEWLIHCVLNVNGIWTNLPSSLVLPLLYLHRTRTLAGCKKNIK